MIQPQEINKFVSIVKDASTQNEQTQIKKKYVKITKQVKDKFLELIIYKNHSIKDASQKLRINYSSAKAILSQHRKFAMHQKRKLKPKAKGIQCQYKLINSQNPFRPIVLDTSIGGKTISSICVIPKTKPIIKENFVIQHNLRMY